MAKKKKAKKAAKAVKAKNAPTKKSKAKKAKKASAPKAIKKKVKAAKKAAPQKAPAKKAVKKTAAKAVPQKTVGEGDYEASRAFLNDQTGFVKKNKAKIPDLGKEAEAALDGPEGADLKAAETEAASHSKAEGE